MKVLSFPATLAALFVMFGAYVADPTSARANDFSTPFGGNASSQAITSNFDVSAEASDAARCAVDTHMPASSLAFHDSNPGLGGNIIPRSWGMHDDDGGWRHHEDDGGDDDHGGKTPVPEPSSALLVLSGITALAGSRLRGRKQQARSANLA